MESGSATPCDYKPLKECLERNGGKKEYCEKEWKDFQSYCSKANKR